MGGGGEIVLLRKEIHVTLTPRQRGQVIFVELASISLSKKIMLEADGNYPRVLRVNSFLQLPKRHPE